MENINHQILDLLKLDGRTLQMCAFYNIRIVLKIEVIYKDISELICLLEVIDGD